MLMHYSGTRASHRLYRLILHLKTGLILESAIHSVPSLTRTRFNKEPECCSDMTLSCFSVILLQHQTVTAWSVFEVDEELESLDKYQYLALTCPVVMTSLKQMCYWSSAMSQHSTLIQAVLSVAITYFLRVSAAAATKQTNMCVFLNVRR